MSEINLKITLQPKQREALNKVETTPVTFYGGSKGSGKSYLIRARQVIRRLKYPNTKGLIVRKTYPELLANHIRMFWKEYPETKNWYNKSEKTIYWPNGSTTEFSYLQSDDDVFTYQGREYEDIDVDEVTQHRYDTIRTLRSSLRTTNQNISPRMLLTGNPGGLGHQEIRRIFVNRDFRGNENPDDYAFVSAKVTDNFSLMENDPEYVKRLNDLPDHLRRAYLDGDWNIFAGLAFSELNTNTHIIDPIELPQETKYFAGYDHGFNHPFAFVLFGIVPDGTVYIVKHLTGRLTKTPEIAQAIKDITNEKGLYIFGGHDAWYPGRGGGPSIVEEFTQCGVGPKNGYIWIQAHTDRKQGANEIRKYISLTDGKPRLYFFRNTSPVFDQISSLQFDDRDPESILKMDAIDGVGGDDLADAFRYGLMSRSYPPKENSNKNIVGTAEEIRKLAHMQNRFRQFIR